MYDNDHSMVVHMAASAVTKSGRGRAGTRGSDKQTTPEFVKYNFRWSRGRCNMLESCRVTLHRRRSSKVRVHGNFGRRGSNETCEYCESP